MGGIEGVSGSKSPSWQDDYDKPLPGAAQHDAANRANAPWLTTSPATPAETAEAFPPAIFTNPTLLGTPGAVAKPPPPFALAPPPAPAAPKPEPLAAAPNAWHGITLANLAEDVPRGTRTDQARAFTCGAGYKLYPEVAKQADGKDAVVYWTAYNTETKRTEFLVGPDSLKAFTSAPSDFANAAANGFMGHGDEVVHESVKAVDVAMRKGPKAAVGQLWHASGVAWTNPDWVAKTVGNVGSTFVQSVAVANRLQLDVRTAAVEGAIAQPEANLYVQHVNQDLPIGKTPGTRTMNCANCVVATDATIAGSPASALPGKVTSMADLSEHFGTPWTACGSDASAIEGAMKAAGPGSRGVVFAVRQGDRVGHFFNVANQSGTVRFIDGQVGSAANVQPYNQFYFLRTN